MRFAIETWSEGVGIYGKYIMTVYGGRNAELSTGWVVFGLRTGARPGSYDIMSREIRSRQLSQANIVIAPDLREIGPFHFHRVDEIISRGEAAARKEVPHIRSML